MAIEVENKNIGHATAYAYAKAGGYTGTEAEFTELLGSIATDLAEIENLSVTVTTLPAGSSATASYADGVLSLGIPKGDKGDTGETPNLTIGTVTTLPAGDNATASITGTAEAPVLSLGIPEGQSGDANNLAADYSSSKTYDVGDYCIYSGSLYRCTTAITTAENWTAAHWTAVALGDDVSNLKSALDKVPYGQKAYKTQTNWNYADYPFTKGQSYKITNNGGAITYTNIYNGEQSVQSIPGGVGENASVTFTATANGTRLRFYANDIHNISIENTTDIETRLKSTNTEVEALDVSVNEKGGVTFANWGGLSYPFINGVTYTIKNTSASVDITSVNIYKDSTLATLVKSIGTLAAGGSTSFSLDTDAGYIRGYAASSSSLSIERSEKNYDIDYQLSSRIEYNYETIQRSAVKTSYTGWNRVDFNFIPGESYRIRNDGSALTYAQINAGTAANPGESVQYLGNIPADSETTITVSKLGGSVFSYYVGSGSSVLTITAVNAIYPIIGKMANGAIAQNNYTNLEYILKDNTKHIISVDANGHGDYTTIAAALSAITDSNVLNQYEVVVYPGVYTEKNLIPPPYVHVHGLQPNTVTVTSYGLSGNDPVFDLQDHTKLSNMTIISYTGYCVHVDINLDRGTVVCEGLYCHKAGGQDSANVGGGSYLYGAYYLFKGCTFDARQVAIHTNPGDANFANTTVVFQGCKFVNSSLRVGSVAGFGKFVMHIENCVFQKGIRSISGWASNMRTKDEPWTYFADSCQWLVIGSGNKYFLPGLTNEYEGLRFVANEYSKDISVSGTAVSDLFGEIKYRKSNSRIKGSASGILRVEDVQAGSSAPVDVFQMWKRLGDCSGTNKTLSVTIDGTTQTYTFDQDYTSSKPTEETIIAAVNAVITNATLEKYSPDCWQNIELDEKGKIEVNSNTGILTGEWLTFDGEIASANEKRHNIFGLALESGIKTEVVQAWCGNQFPYEAEDGEYGIGHDGTLSGTATEKIGYVKDDILYLY